jgi:PAT family beta-lactamase induction signal transducer AmpG
MGLPFVALAASSSIMYKNLGISDSKIAFWTSLIMLPWTLKPLWGPFLEMFKTKKFFVYTTQIFTGVLFGLVGLSLQLDAFFSVSMRCLPSLPLVQLPMIPLPMVFTSTSFLQSCRLSM